MKVKHINLGVAALILLGASCRLTDVMDENPTGVLTGAEVLIAEHLTELEGKRVGLVGNPTSRIGERHLLDILLELDVNVTALFAPEHGFRGDFGAGEEIADGMDVATGIPVFSLYGDTRRPTPEMLGAVDLLLFDIQDVGARFYTYIATMGKTIEAAAEYGVSVWILDRPNPAGGDYVSGWVREEEFASFVAPYPIPIAHGMTIGEIARMIVGEGWIDFADQSEVTVIPMRGWRRDMKWPDTAIEWVPPSPNLPTFDHAYMYLGTVYFEGTTLSEGRGTDDPFLLVGDPTTRLTEADIEYLRGLTASIEVSPVEFVPRSITGVAPTPKHQDAAVRGLRIEVLDHDYDPVRVGLAIFQTVLGATAEYATREFIYELTGSREIDGIISGEKQIDQIDFDLDPFKSERNQYIIY